MQNKTAPTTFHILRAILGIIFITHGIARLYYGSVPQFGEFLSGLGLPFGTLLAWMITIGEMVSGTCLALGFFVRYCVVFHALIVAVGIFVVHLQNGWFVVGHGSGGVEYSILLLAALAHCYGMEKRPFSPLPL